jgi:hypothetical protein
MRCKSTNGVNMDFLNTALTFPTVIFSVLLIIVIIFWLVTIAGLADIDMFEADVEIESQTNAATSGLFNSLGLTDIPLTVSASLMIMSSWLISTYAQTWFLPNENNNLYYLFGITIMLVSSILALPITSILAKPLKRFFTSKETATKNDFVGLECVIATSKVTDTFGQARVTFQGTEQLVEIRIQDDTHQFNLGDNAILIEHMSENHSYIIAPKPWA